MPTGRREQDPSPGRNVDWVERTASLVHPNDSGLLHRRKRFGQFCKLLPDVTSISR